MPADVAVGVFGGLFDLFLGNSVLVPEFVEDVGLEDEVKGHGKTSLLL